MRLAVGWGRARAQDPYSNAQERRAVCCYHPLGLGAVIGSVCDAYNDALDGLGRGCLALHA